MKKQAKKHRWKYVFFISRSFLNQEQSYARAGQKKN